MGGELIVKTGMVVLGVLGAPHGARPDYDKGIEKSLKDYFDRFHTVAMENFKLADDEIVLGDKGSIVVQPTAARAS
jgi:formylmethanofuran dehydrogenase subunit A